MTYRGRVKNGVIVLDAVPAVADGQPKFGPAGHIQGDVFGRLPELHHAAVE